MKERIKFTTPTTTMKELIASGTDSDTANKVVAVASIIKSFTKNVMIDVSHENCGLLHGEAWFYMKNSNEEERFNNATAYKVLVNLIDPKIKVGAFLWPDNVTGGCIDGVHCDVIDINFFGYTFSTRNGEQAGSEEQAKKEEHAREACRNYVREEAELCLREAAERLKQGSNPEVDENTPVNPMRLMNLWGTDDDDDDDDDIERWANERYSFGEDE